MACRYGEGAGVLAAKPDSHGHSSDGRFIIYSAGHLIFLRRGTLMAVPLDLNRLDIRGQPVPVVANIMQAINRPNSGYNTCAGQFDNSDSGCLACITGGVVPDMENSLVWVDQRGTAQAIASFKAPFTAPRLSPDGQRIMSELPCWPRWDAW
jgi:hypothetical protein